MVSISGRNSLGALAVGAVASLAFGGGVADAGPSDISATYPVNGVAHVKNAGFDSKIGPGTFSAKLSGGVSGGQFTGSFTVPPTKASFTVMGMIPVSADVQLVETAPVTGTLTNGAADAKITFKVQVSNATAAGMPIDLGDKCTSDGSATIDVKSDAGFSVLNGGTLSSTFPLPPYVNCGMFTGIINQVIPGPGNTLKLTLGKPEIQH